MRLDEVEREVTSSVFNTVLCEVIARRRDSDQPLRWTRPPTFYWKTSNKVGRTRQPVRGDVNRLQPNLSLPTDSGPTSQSHNPHHGDDVPPHPLRRTPPHPTHSPNRPKCRPSSNHYRAIAPQECTLQPEMIYVPRPCTPSGSMLVVPPKWSDGMGTNTTSTDRREWRKKRKEAKTELVGAGLTWPRCHLHA